MLASALVFSYCIIERVYPNQNTDIATVCGRCIPKDLVVNTFVFT